MPETCGAAGQAWLLQSRPICISHGHAQHAGAAAALAEGTELTALRHANVAVDGSLLHLLLLVTLQANAGRTVQAEFLRHGRLIRVQLNLHGRLGCHLRPL